MIWLAYGGLILTLHFGGPATTVDLKPGYQVWTERNKVYVPAPPMHFMRIKW